ncbi:MAG TPA: oxygenase MpaB family protein [Puia sp.]|nr:oxygenase MpaB family protein [Puia sp.]
MKQFFVHDGSIVRKIWGRGDTVLLVFAGASAEFALNKAVDWLYFTGRLPADPLGRLFSTVRYAQEIVFADQDAALAAIDKITAVHQGVEKSRGARIPDDAYLDVLFMLIDYSIRSFELLERRLAELEKAEVFDVFYRVGLRMGLKGLPGSYRAWKDQRAANIAGNLVRSVFTPDLYERYRKSLGAFRYYLLLQVQVLLVPARVRRLVGLSSVPLLWPVLLLYKAGRWLGCDRFVRDLLLPVKYKEQIAALDLLPG